MIHKLADFSREKVLWEKGVNLIAGADEVGRGAFAGPVMTGVVAFPKEISFSIKIHDSKMLTPKQRLEASIWIRKNCLYGIGISSVNVINKIGIVKATNKAFRQAIKNLTNKSGNTVDALLIDAFYIPNISGINKNNQFPIIRGDKISASIAAASIIAKVERDNYMQDLSSSKAYRKYNWGNNKGYGTKEHREMIIKFGSTIHHRVQFVNSFLRKQS